ncbi:NAD(P)-dependent oxidoreductase [Singulisphaera sp. Ch08]|uniref:NAD(P)-dependent oxidoreductase n=1 Tax=Singulisphaera sp. Ch08 TaxID=3120278 RepID=A0AAU7CNI4_9BACT
MSVERKIGVIGLGLMGTAISLRLLEHGYSVRVWNRTQEEAAPLVERGAVWSDAVATECDRVVICLYSSDIVAMVVGPLLPDLRAGQVFVDTTTGEPAQSEAMGAQLAARGVSYLAAPISGSSEQTRRGEATVIVGGGREAFEGCADLWPVLGRNVFHVGGWGDAARMKLASNLVLGLNRAALAEGLAFAEAIGLEPAAALEVLKGSMAYSRAMDVKGRKMIERDFSVQARLSQHLKDVRLMLDAAADAGLSLPLSETHRRLMERAEAEGWGDLDNSAIIDVYRSSSP